jgi:DNA primase
MSLIPADRLRALRNDVPVLAVISDLEIPTKRRGARLTFRCPECRGFNTATHPRTNLARCFSCQRNFNPIEVVMAERGTSFLEAVDYLLLRWIARDRNAETWRTPVEVQREREKGPNGLRIAK